MGCLAQLTALSYVGVFGKISKKQQKQWLNIILFRWSLQMPMALQNAPLKEAYEQIGEDFGLQKVTLMKQVAKDLINRDQISFPSYIEVKKRNSGYFRGNWVV